MIELIDGRNSGLDIYTGWVPDGAFAIRYHHLGYLVEDEAGWAALQDAIAKSGRRIAFANELPWIRATYIEAPDLGHYLEYVYPIGDGKQFLERVPRN